MQKQNFVGLQNSTVKELMLFSSVSPSSGDKEQSFQDYTLRNLLDFQLRHILGSLTSCGPSGLVLTIHMMTGEVE